ncbi:MAG: PD-(D/E)XK nuclease family protein [Acidobacteriota bacterium]|nr:PD-(D/E)XK nuclease family protein [Acidobacteriota bacterium]
MPQAGSRDPFISQLTDLCAAAPTRAKWVFVPTHAIGRMLGDRLVLEGRDWANLRFVTPFDIATRMGAPFLVERGIDPSEEGLGPALIMRLLLDLPEQPSYFRPLAHHPAMAQALWTTIRELRMAGVKPVDLVATAFGSPDKHAEMQALYRAYEAFLSTSARGDMATVYEDALQHPGWCPIQPQDCWTEMPAAAWTPLQRRLLDALPGERMAPRSFELPGAATPRRLASAALDVVAPDAASPLAFLQSPGTAGDKPKGLSPRQKVHLFHAGGREAEVEEVFRRILDVGCPLDQVEVASASADYTVLLWEKACRHEWPVTLSSGLPASLTRPGRALVGLGAWIESDFAAGDLRRLLQSGDVTLGDGDLSPGQAARVLVKAEAAWGRKTYELSLGKLSARYRLRAADTELPDDQRDAATRKAEQSDHLLAWVTSLLRSIPEPDATDQIELQHLVDGVSEFIESCVAKTSALDGAAAIALASATAELKALGSFRCTLMEGLRFINERVDGLHVGADRARPGHLHVSALAQVGYPGRPHVFVVGLEEGRVFPSATEDPVLLDVERSRISPLLRLSSDRSEEAVSAVLHRLAATSGSVSITLSYSCRDLREFRQTFPSWLMLQAHRIVSGQPESSFPDLLNALGPPASCVPANDSSALGEASWWLHGLKRAGLSGHAAVLQQYALLQQGLHADEQRDSDAFTEFDGFVPDAGVYLDPCTRDAPVSATQLEKAAECPFRHFLERGLGLVAVDDGGRDSDVWLDPLTRGSLLHALYARLMRRSRDEQRRLSIKDDLAFSETITRDELDKLRVEMPPPSQEVFDREFQGFMDDVVLFVTAEDASDASRTAVGFEVSFGRPGSEEGEPLARKEPIVIDLGGGLKFRLAGQIDRIDQVGDACFEVIDYKTGGYFEKDWAGITSGGRKLQHALYGLAAAELLKLRVKTPTVTHGTYYFTSAKGGQERRTIDAMPRAKLTSVLSDLRQVIASGLFVHAPDESACKWCDFGNACGARVQARAGAKTSADAGLEPYRRLAAHE